MCTSVHTFASFSWFLRSCLVSRIVRSHSGDSLAQFKTPLTVVISTRSISNECLFTLKSMPTVEMKLPARKAPSLKRTSRQVFPTPESPTSITWNARQTEGERRSQTAQLKIWKFTHHTHTFPKTPIYRGNRALHPFQWEKDSTDQC